MKDYIWTNTTVTTSLESFSDKTGVYQSNQGDRMIWLTNAWYYEVIIMIPVAISTS